MGHARDKIGPEPSHCSLSGSSSIMVMAYLMVVVYLAKFNPPSGI
jgi:hypothetical protein